MGMNYTKNYLIFNKKKIEYFTFGNGKREVLCLQGWGLPPDIWFKFIEKFQTNDDSLKFIIIDLGSIDVGTEISISNFAKLIAGMASGIENQSPYAIIGHSMGVTIMFEIMKLHLMSPENIVIVDSGTRSSKRNGEIIKLVESKNFKTLMFRNIVKSFFVNISEDDLNSLMDKIKRYNIDELAKQLILISSFDYSSFVEKIKTPTLIFFGKNDKNRSLEEVTELNQKIANSKLVILQNSAHCPMYEEPEKFAFTLLNFLNHHV